MENLELKEKLITKILDARENKRLLIKSYLKDYNIVTVKANIVGINKNVFEAKIIVSYFENIIDKYNYIEKEFIDSSDGPYLLYKFPKNVKMKEDLIRIEEQDEIGRLVDLDCYEDNNEKSLNRNVKRKCLLCNNDAFICNRMKNHSEEEIFQKIDELLFIKLEQIITVCLDEAIMMELKLPNKFGCVSIDSNASHTDMNHLVMEKAKDAILPYLVLMFKEGLVNNDLFELLKKIKQIGITAENKMMEATGNINCYKGLIFSLGLLVSSLGYMLINKQTFNDIFINIKNMTIDLNKEYNITKENSTYGIYAYKTLKIEGARKEAKNGLKIVHDAFQYCSNLENFSLVKTLIYIISNIDDTVMLKRAGNVTKYLNIKTRISNLLNNFDKDEYMNINKYCEEEHISCGGSCDLLICVIFLKLFNAKIKIN